MTKLERALLIAIITAGAVMRIAWNDVARYSPADETIYTSYAATLHDKGFISAYPEITGWFLNDPKMARFPNPLRFGYLALAALSEEFYGATEPRALAWLSTIAGILVIPLLFVIGRQLFGVRAGLLAAAFAAMSSIELALGRRALQDEVFCLAVLFALAVTFLALEEWTPKHVIAAIAAVAIALSIKETFLFLYPAFFAVILTYRRRGLWLFLLPPAIDYVVLTALTRDFTAMFRIGRIVWTATAANYVVQYQGGPPHRLLLDFFITSPFVLLLATAAIAMTIIGRNSGKRERALALFVIIGIAALSIFPSKNLRFAVMLDPMIRLLAAWLVAVPAVTGRALSGFALSAIATVNAAIELELFHTIFIRGGVYDLRSHNRCSKPSAPFRATIRRPIT